MAFFSVSVFVFGQNENKTKQRTFSRDFLFLLKEGLLCCGIHGSVYANDDWKHHNKRIKWFINFKLKDLLLLDCVLRNFIFVFKNFCSNKNWHKMWVLFSSIRNRLSFNSLAYFSQHCLQIWYLRSWPIYLNFCFENLF